MIIDPFGDKPTKTDNVILPKTHLKKPAAPKTPMTKIQVAKAKVTKGRVTKAQLQPKPKRQAR